MKKSIEGQKHIVEKTIQRYIFEKLNFGNIKTLKEFFPYSIYENITKRRIKVIIPEYPLYYLKYENGEEKKYQHYTDFRIIYNDGSFHNVEVEWSTSRFNSHSKEVYDQLYKNGCISQVKSEPFRNLILSHGIFVHFHPFLSFPHSIGWPNHI